MNETALEQDACPLCGAAGDTWTRRGDRELRRCRACSFAWVRQGLMRGSSGLSIYEDGMPAFMTEYPDYYQDASALDAARDKLQWVRRHALDGGRLLDVGANLGFFAKEASRHFETEGLEPAAAMVEWGRAHLQAPIEVGSIDDPRQDFRDRFDVITMFDVIEHVPDPRGALERCREYLAPGGRLFITTPDAGSAMARLLGRQWYYLDLVQHIALFNRANLTRLLADTGFALVATRTVGRRYRCSYIERRLRDLAAGSATLRIAHAAALPLKLWPAARIPLNLGDVMGVVAERRP